ncbi:MAG: signal peptidase II [Desulfobulbaceae bacterium]|nr:MAG: signal peptidase II [Desulfobulbaceae bacterium]
MRSYVIIIALVFVADQVSKYLIISNFALYEARVVIPDFFNLVYVTNKGAAFSLFASIESSMIHYFFVLVKISAFIGLTIAAFVMRNKSLPYVIAFAMISAGALGNVVDRLVHGAVIDFLDFYLGSYHWPAFNVADSSICVGVAVLFYINITEIISENKRRSA